MRLLIAFGLATLLTAPLSYAQHPARTTPLGRSSHPQTGTVTTRSTTTAARPLSTAPEWADLANQTADSTESGLSHRHRIGGLHLTFGAIGLTGGTVSGIAVYKFFRIGGRSNSFFPKALGSMFIIPAIGFTALGIYTTIRGIRILKGEAPPIGWVPGPHFSTLHHSSPFSQQSSLSLTISL